MKSASLAVRADPQQGEITGYSLWDPNTGRWREQPPAIAPGQNAGIRAYGRNTGTQVQRMRMDFVIAAPDGSTTTATGQEASVEADQEAFWECVFAVDQEGAYQVTLKLYGEEERPGMELVSAWFDDGNPMSKKPADTFTVTVRIKNNLERDWSPANLWFGFGQAGVLAPVVWGLNPFTGETDPRSCWVLGKWPLGAWPIVPAGTTKDFQVSYGLCPGAAAGTYDGYISIEPYGQTPSVTIPSILTIVWPRPRLTIIEAVLRDARIGMKYGRSKIYGTVDLTVSNDEGRTLTGQSPDYVDIQVSIFRTSDNARVGFCRMTRDIPAGTNTLSLTPSIGFGSDVPLEPDALDYRLHIRIVLRGWPGDPYVEAEFFGGVTLT